MDASLNIDTSTVPVKDWWRMESNASSNHCAALNTVTTTDYRREGTIVISMETNTIFYVPHPQP